jgi:hypothetical protein
VSEVTGPVRVREPAGYEEMSFGHHILFSRGKYK